MAPPWFAVFLAGGCKHRIMRPASLRNLTTVTAPKSFPRTYSRAPALTKEGAVTVFKY